MRVPQDLVPYLSWTPQPVALSLGRVVRSVSRPERLEASLKAGEMLTRYLAVAALASCAATRPDEEQLPAISGFDGNLSFGVFEKAIRQAIAVPWSHPLRDDLRAAMRSTKKRTAIAGVKIERFVQLRNELGHAVTHVDDLRAGALFEQHDPIGGLIASIDDLSPVLAAPPLAVLRQEHRRGRLSAQVLFFVGEGDPIPSEIELANGVFDWEKPYLCTAEGLLPLSPGISLRARPDGRRGLYLIDGIEDGAVRYKGAFDNDVVRMPGADHTLCRWLSNLGAAFRNGRPEDPLLERVSCSDGRSLLAFLRNEPVLEASRLSEPAERGGRVQDTGKVWTLGSFEQAINNVGLGAAFRDAVYGMAERGCRAEGSPEGVRIVGGDAGRVLVVIELQPGPALLFTLHLAAFPAGGHGTESIALRPAQTADELVAHLSDLMGAHE